MGHDFFLIKFDHQEDLDTVLTEGPWIIQDHYLTVQRWQPDFIPAQATINLTLAWISIPGLSMIYYDDNALCAIAFYIGTPVKIDSNMTLATHGKFARVCVEVDLTKPLTGGVMLDGHWQRVEYEGFHVVCYQCGCYRHTTDLCMTKINSLKEKIAIAISNGRGMVLEGREGSIIAVKMVANVGEEYVIREDLNGQQPTRIMGHVVYA